MDVVSGELRVRVWDVWRESGSARAVSRVTGVPVARVSQELAVHGGMRPRVGCRGRRSVTGWEREEISRGLCAGKTQAEIARELGRDPSVISREVTRHGGREHYRAEAAEQAAERNRRRPKTSKLARYPRLRAWVTSALELGWSPRQIASRLKRDFPRATVMRVSHETIYQSLYLQTRGEFRREMHRYLRRQHPIRQPRGTGRRSQGRGQIPDKVMLSERPPEADDRAVPGHWEGDLILGSHGTAVATLVERHSRFVQLVALPHGKKVEQVTDALTHAVTRLPGQLWRSLTWDQGKEMSHHTRFTLATGIPIYFCPPGTPWLRGSNENTNGLLREYLPKNSDLSRHTQTHLDHYATLLNQRPRHTLNWKTPAEQLDHHIAHTP